MWAGDLINPVRIRHETLTYYIALLGSRVNFKGGVSSN